MGHFRRELIISGGAVPRRAGVAFDLLSLSPHLWLDPSDLTTLFQERTGASATTPSVIDGVVGSMHDKSIANGFWLTAPSDAARPILRNSGSLYWLEFDGVDDYLSIEDYGGALSNPLDRVSGFRRLSDQAGFRQFIHGNGNNTALLQDSEGDLSLYSGTLNAVQLAMPAVDADFVATERHNGASSRLAVDNGSYATGNPGDVAATGIRVCFGGGGDFVNARFYGLVQRTTTFTDPEIAHLRTYLAAKQGRAL